MVMAAAASGRSFLHCVGDNEKRWLVFGIGLNKVLVSQIRSFVEREIQKEYCNIKSSHGIDTQATPTRLTHWPNLPAKKVFLKYENINGNDARPKVHGKFNYSAFDCRVLSHIDFAKLYVENFMAKFNAFDEHCDASAVLILLSKVPVFSATVQSAASDLRQSRNSWAHCAFKDWDTVKFRQSFDEMEKLVKALGLPVGDQAKLLSDLQDWESKGTLLCMNATVDPDLLQLVQHHVNELKSDVDKMSFDMESERKSVEKALKNFDELDARVSGLEQGFGHLQHEQKSLKSDVEDLERFVERVQVQRNWEIANCESDIDFFAERHDPDTRHWLFDDFCKWFSDPGDSRAYVLLGDAGVGKSVIAGALAQRMKKAGHLGAAYFCRHNDGTRNDPRCLLGTVASELCKCNCHYNNIVGGVDSVITMLHNDKLGVQELFTKLLEEPLAKCTHLAVRKLVIIDALDETEYESREDFLCLIKERLPRLPRWIVFFITSRPEDTIRGRLQRYNPCVRVCAGDKEQSGIYQQHEGDIRRFFENGVDFTLLPFTLEEMTKSCNGLFLHAFYLRKKLNDLAKTRKIDYTPSDLLVDDIEDFFRDNFQRVFSKISKDLYEKLIGCVLAAPSPLPVSFIPFVLQQETSSLDEQEVVDAVMQFALNQTSNDTVTFLHKLIPTWLTKNPRKRDYQRKPKRKDCPHLLIEKKKAYEYLARTFAEILSVVVEESSPALSCLNVDVQDYTFRFAIRFLCQYGDQESEGIVFRCLTSLHFLEKRIKSGKIGIYHLLEDLKLASCCPTFEDSHKKNILHEIFNALESNVHILLECPHLLIACLRSGSKVLQETSLIPKLSGPLLEWSAFDGEGINFLSGFNVFATASDKRTVAASNGRSIVFVDASRLTIASGPFEISQLIINEIKHLEFSPDGKWVFFGRLDKWFSVERKSVEDFSQFSGNEVSYEWSTFTRDDQYIVVKRTGTFSAFECGCKTKLLALWALQEIHHNRSEMTCSFDTVLLPDISCASNLRGLAERLLDYLQAQELYQPAELFKSLFSCYYSQPFCKKLEELQQSIHDLSLTAVRQVVVELYSYIFDFQVWNVHTGRPLLHDVFSLSVQLNEFAYFWHVRHDTHVKGLHGIIAKASSISNIAVATAVHAVILPEMSSKDWEDIYLLRLNGHPDWTFFKFLCYRLSLCPEKMAEEEEEEEEEVFMQRKEWLQEMSYYGLTSSLREEQEFVMRKMAWQSRMHFNRRMRSLKGHPEENEDIRRQVAWLTRMHFNGRMRSLKGHPEEKEDIRRQVAWLARMHFNRRMRSLKGHPEEKEDIRRQVAWLARMFLAFSRKNSHLFLEQVFCVSFFCVSPHKKWLLLSYPDERSILRVYSLSKGNEEQHFLDANCIMRDLVDPLCDFTFTNDDSYFIYSTSSGSLHALCLQTGSILKSAWGKNLFYSTEERQIGYYLFQSDRGERKEIYCTDLFSPFEFVRSTEAGAISFLLRYLLPDSSEKMLEMCVPSPDGNLIAIHRGNKIELIGSPGFLDTEAFTVYEQQTSFTAAVTFSSDCKLLLFCVQDGVNDPHFQVWCVKEGECMALHTCKLTGTCLLTFACCCLSSDKTKLILCGDNEVEIWEYNSSCRLLARSGVSSSYNTLSFSQCAVSVDNKLLACCIENIVVLFSLQDPGKISQCKRILSGHLARILFCNFLKINRYLLTYDIDGLVFLWDLERTKPVTFAKITQDQESIVGLLDNAVCLLSSSRVCVIKPCRLEDEPLSKFWIHASTEDTVNSSETSRHSVRELISKSEIPPANSRNEDFSLSQWEDDGLFFYDDDDDGDDVDDDDDDDDDKDDDDDGEVDKND